MDSFNENTQTSRTITQFAHSDTSAWTVIKVKKNSVKGIWSFNASRSYGGKMSGTDVGFHASGQECGFFKFNKKKDTLKLYLTGLEGCDEKQAARGRKKLIGKVKGVDFEDIFDVNSGSFDITGIVISSTVNGISSVKNLYQFGFKSALDDEVGPYAVDISNKYMKGSGKFETKMDTDGELVSIFGQTVGEFESMSA